MFVNSFILSRIRYYTLVSELWGFQILAGKMSALHVKIDNRTRGSGATPLKLTAYMMYGLGLDISYIYNAYLCISIPIDLFLSSACGSS